MNLRGKAFLAGVALLGVSAIGFAQNYPVPAKTPATVVPCATCANGLPGQTVGWTAPIASFTGRYLDSSGVQEFFYPFRTARSNFVLPMPGIDRIYFRYNNGTVAAYTLSTFFSRLAAGEQIAWPQSFPLTLRSGLPYEKFLTWSDFFDPEMNSGWTWKPADGATRLTWFDVDDQGYVYVASTVYGWGVAKDSLANGGSMKVMFQQTNLQPSSIVALKAGSRYYAYINVKGQSLWDVTNRANPVAVPGNFPSLSGYAKNSTADTFAMLSSTGALQVWSVASFVSGGAPLFTTPNTGYQRVSSDGTNFFGLRSTGGSAAIIDVIVPSGATYAITASYPITTLNFVSNFHAGGGYIVLTGLDPVGAWDMQVYKLGANFAPTKLTINASPADPSNPSYFRDYYSLGPSGFTVPGNSVFVDAMVYRSPDGHVYLITCFSGTGDVYELQAGDTITVANNGPAGTPNPNSPVAGRTNTYYGDPISFTGKTTSTTISGISWNFGNPEAGLANSSQLTAPNQSLSYQYSNLTPATLGIKTVAATSTGDATVRGTTTVTVQAPTARFAIANTSPLYLFTQPNASSPAPIIAGDSFVDASDGTVESHYTSWLLDGTTTKLLPSQPMSVGRCGSHSLTFTTYYGPYTGAGSTLATTRGATVPDFIAGLGPTNNGVVTYGVLPFAAGMTVSSTSATSITFSSTTRVTTDLTLLGAGANTLTYTWQLLNSAGSVIAALGTGPTCVVQKQQLVGLTNARVQLTVTSPPLNGTSCAGYEKSVALSAPLNAPDPKITMTGDCQTTPCTFTAGSVSGIDTVANGWTYQWLINGAPVDNVSASASNGSTGSTFSPTFLKSGTYTVSVNVTNAIGSASVAAPPMTLTIQLCSPMKATSFTLVFQGAVCSSANSTPCTPGETVTFTAASYGYDGYNVGCAPHTYTWKFPDGTQTSSQSAQVTHTVQAPGGQVELDVNNGTTTMSWTAQMNVGGSAPPPGGGGNPCAGMSASNIFPAWIGASCPNGGTCSTNDPLTFSVQTLGYVSTCLQSATWSFGDGASGAGLANVQHTYTTSGSHNGSFSVTDTAGETVTKSFTVTTAPGSGNPGPGPDPCGTLSNSSVFIAYNGASCSTGQSCRDGDSITFSIQTLGIDLTCGSPTFDWDFGDGSAHGNTSQTTHSYSTAGSHTVTLSITRSGTVFSRSVSLTTTAGGGGGTCAPVTPNLTLSINYADASNTCGPLGGACNAGETVNFSILVYGSYDITCATHTYDWDFGDGSPHSSSATPTHVYQGGGTYHASCIVNNGQSYTLTQDVRIQGSTVKPTVQPTIIVESMQGVANGFIFTPKFDNPGAVASWTWNFGDGKTETDSGSASSPTPSAHIYADNKKYTVTLTAYSGTNGSGQALGAANAPNTPTVEKRRSVRH